MITEEITNQSAAPKADPFNWETSGKGWNNYSAEERTRMEKMYDQTLNAVVEHDIVEGIVVSVSPKDVLINIGYKAEGLIPLTEFRHMPDIKAGDKVEVYVEKQEDKNGQLLLSHKKARALKSWDRINAALEGDEVITGYAMDDVAQSKIAATNTELVEERSFVAEMIA